MDFDSSNKYPLSYHSISEAVLSLGPEEGVLDGGMSYQVFPHAAYSLIEVMMGKII